MGEHSFGKASRPDLTHETNPVLSPIVDLVNVPRVSTDQSQFSDSVLWHLSSGHRRHSFDFWRDVPGSVLKQFPVTTIVQFAGLLHASRSYIKRSNASMAGLFMDS